MASRRVVISSSRAEKRKYGAVRESAHSQTDGQSTMDSGEDGFDPVSGDGGTFPGCRYNEIGPEYYGVATRKSCFREMMTLSMKLQCQYVLRRRNGRINAYWKKEQSD